MFRKAVKRDAKVRLALCGPAVSGTMYGLLAIASERAGRRARRQTNEKLGGRSGRAWRVRCARLSPKLGGGIAYFDADPCSVSTYADLLAFDVGEPADAAEQIYKRAAAQYPLGTQKDPIRIKHVRRTVWALEEKRKAIAGQQGGGGVAEEGGAWILRL